MNERKAVRKRQMNPSQGKRRKRRQAGRGETWRMVKMSREEKTREEIMGVVTRERAKRKRMG